MVGGRLAPFSNRALGQDRHGLILPKTSSVGPVPTRRGPERVAGGRGDPGAPGVGIAVLERCGTTGCAPAVPRLSLGCAWAVPGLFPGCPRTVPRLSPGCARLSPDCPSAVPGCPPAVPGCPSAVPRLSLAVPGSPPGPPFPVRSGRALGAGAGLPLAATGAHCPSYGGSGAQVAKPSGAQVPSFPETQMPRCPSTQVLSAQVLRHSGSQSAPVPRCTGTQVLSAQVLKVPKCSVPRYSGTQVLEVPRCSVPKVPRCPKCPGAQSAQVLSAQVLSAQVPLARLRTPLQRCTFAAQSRSNKRRRCLITPR